MANVVLFYGHPDDPEDPLSRGPQRFQFQDRWSRLRYLWQNSLGKFVNKEPILTRLTDDTYV